MPARRSNDRQKTGFSITLGRLNCINHSYWLVITSWHLKKEQEIPEMRINTIYLGLLSVLQLCRSGPGVVAVEAEDDWKGLSNWALCSHNNLKYTYYMSVEERKIVVGFRSSKCMLALQRRDSQLTTHSDIKRVSFTICFPCLATNKRETERPIKRKQDKKMSYSRKVCF